MTNAIASIVVNGKTVLERKVSALRQGDNATSRALVGSSGAVGKLARGDVAKGGMALLAQRCADNNYLGVAAYIAATLGVSFQISNRASFESVPDRLDSMVADARLAKNGGMREDKKTGLMVAGSKLATAMHLKAEFVELVGIAASIRAARTAAQPATV